MAGENEELIAVLPQAVVFVRSQLQSRGASLVQAFADVGDWLQLDEEAPREFCDAFIYLTEQGLITGRAFAPSIEVVHELLLPDRKRVHRGRSLRLGRSGFWTREGHKSDRLGRSTVTPFRVVGEIGEAQVGFRSANEKIQASADRLTLVRAIPFICECPNEDCSAVVNLTFDEYESIRQHPRRFFNVTGHECSSVDAGAERIIAVAGELTVVEKIGIAGDIASDAHDSRQST